MIDERCYRTFENKTYCVRCGSKFRLENDDGLLVLRCAGGADGRKAVCQVPVITWEDLAAAVNKATTITDLHLDFLWEAVERIEIDGYRVNVTMDQITGERKSNLLRCQDYWLVQHSLLGDEKARDKIYSIHDPLVKRKLYFLGRNSSLKRRDLEDLEQAIWLRTFQYLSSYNGQYRLWTWMKLVIRTEFYKMYTRKRKEIASEDSVRIQLEVREACGKSNIDRWMDHDHVSNLLSILTERERLVVVEHIFNNRQLKELAVDLHVCKQRAHQIYHEALKKMREYELRGSV